MLRTLTIRDFVIVDTIELEFASGFSVFTGETGAGKSILIDALQLALGGRGDASVVREGAAKADITADFAVSEAAAPGWLQNEFAVEEGGALLRRVIDNAGRSKAFINGIAATAGQLRELGDMLVDIHGQHAHQSLLKLRRAARAARQPGRVQDAGAARRRWRSPRLQATGARWCAARGIREQRQERADRARAARVAGGRAGKAGRQAGRMGRDRQ
jgi:DNA repair protein RecN (Recombination protein N)